MPDRRFRDMRLTEDDVLALLERHCSRVSVWYYPGCDVAAEEWRLFERAKRLLSLWRDIGLRELRYSGWIDGHNHATKKEESPF